MGAQTSGTFESGEIISAFKGYETDYELGAKAALRAFIDYCIQMPGSGVFGLIQGLIIGSLFRDVQSDFGSAVQGKRGLFSILTARVSYRIYFARAGGKGHG